MQLSRPSNMERLVFSKFIGLIYLYLCPSTKSFLKTLFLMIRRLPVTICLWYLSEKGELLLIINNNSLVLVFLFDMANTNLLRVIAFAW